MTELLEGETLRERLGGGPLPVRKAIEYGIQIAHGLSTAHEKAIVHRDLKPENIFITHDGRVKILDFGLAKLTQPDSPIIGGTNVPTTPLPNETQAGLVLGTIGYMAPEQVRGQAIDHRADVFAFGAILYEILSGQRAFKGDTTIDTMTAILKDDPQDLPVEERHIPPALPRIIDRCLEKSAASRFHSMHDLAIALETLSSHSESTLAVPATQLPVRRLRAWLPWAMAAAASVAAIALGAWVFLRAPAQQPTFRLTLLPPPGVVVDDAAPSRLMALSPDGRRIAFIGVGADRRRMLWVRPLNSLTAQQLAGTEDALSPFWSPDGGRIGCFAGAGTGKLKVIDLDGGPPTTVCDYIGAAVGADWNTNGVILFSTNGSDGALRRVPEKGGAPEVVITPDSKAGEVNLWWPVFLPDGQHYLYLSMGAGRTPVGVYVASLGSSDRKLVLKGASNVRYANSRLLFLRGSTLMAQAFDVSRLELQGDAVPLAEQVQINPPTGAFSVSHTGVLVYKSGDATGNARLVWFDAAGRQLGTVGERGAYGDLRLSPDGKRAAVSLPATGGTRDIWIVDIARDFLTPFTFDPADDSSPVWSADGSRIVFRSNRRGAGDLYEKPSSGAGTETVLLPDTSAKAPMSWSSDGKFLLYVRFPTATSDPAATLNSLAGVWVLPLTGNRTPFAFASTPFGEPRGKFSPNGRWVAYVSTESGRPEIWVAEFPGTGVKWRVSRDGGTQPVWHREGKEIFYLSLDSRLMAVPVAASANAMDVGVARPLFAVRPGGPRDFYDVTADGRFLVNSAPERSDTSLITLVVNWPGALKN